LNDEIFLYFYAVSRNMFKKEISKVLLEVNPQISRVLLEVNPPPPQKNLIWRMVMRLKLLTEFVTYNLSGYLVDG
jgi:hypothetical protein